MRNLLLSISFLISVTTFGQQPVVEKVVSHICASLSNTEIPLEELTPEESRNIIRAGLIKNYSDWMRELNEFKKRTGLTDHEFDLYFQHILLIECENFRKIDKINDPNLSDQVKLRPLYIKTKKFVYGLEDNLINENLKRLLNDSLKNEEIDSLLNFSKFEIDKIKRTTTLSILLIYVDGYTFRVRYFDYLTNEPEFQIDVIFRDGTNLLIDSLVIKGKAELMLELNERIEFDKKVESGEVELQPPSPPSSPEKNE